MKDDKYYEKFLFDTLAELFDKETADSFRSSRPRRFRKRRLRGGKWEDLP